jgi:hypothetical protein
METLKFSAASDVWSFAIVMVEVFQDGVAPYKELKNAEVMQKVMAGYKHPRPPDCNAAVYEMLCQCWETDPANRPHFIRIVKVLKFTHDHVGESPSASTIQTGGTSVKQMQQLRSTGSTPTSVMSTGAAATRRDSIQNLQYLTPGVHMDDQQGIAETSFGVNAPTTADEESQHGGESAYEYQGAVNNALHMTATRASTESDYEYQTSVSALLQQQTNHLPKGAIVLDDTHDYITVGQGRDSGDDESDDEFAC